MNIRNIALVAGIVMVGAANAQSFELKAGAGATLSGTTFTVGATGPFTVELWLNTGSAATSITSINFALAFGNAVGSGTSATPAATNKLQFVSAAYAGDGLAAFGTQLGTAFQVRGAAATIASGANYTNNPYPIVVNNARGAASAQNIAGGSFKLASYTFNHSLAANTSAVDVLFAANQGGTGSAQNGASGITGSRFGSVKYSVQAVPEPGTMLALAAGLSAIAARRRNKK
ncbi:MAG: PEP-CTERM sorting domain-containing protein [Armatimonadetes bacterium]|nr:PEP-CTERM sorting domain-containing protein [Armatimonadota bacterium]